MELVEEMDEWYLGNLWLNDLFIDKDSLLDVVDDNDHVANSYLKTQQKQSLTALQTGMVNMRTT